MKKIKKEYAYKDVIMLTVARIVACNLKDNLKVLSAKNVKWNEDYVNDFHDRIEVALENNLGYDIKQELRSATSKVNELTAEVCDAIGMFKRLVLKFYKGETQKRNEIITLLGFKNYSQKNVARTQLGLINLLFTFKVNLSDDLRKELVAKGIPGECINSIIEYANVLEKANNLQEVLKGNTYALYADRMELYNAIYREVTGVCVIASAVFKYVPAKRVLFNFRKLAGLTSKKHKEELLEKLQAEEKSDKDSNNSSS